MGSKNIMCSECGFRPAKTNGLCNACYVRQWRKKTGGKAANPRPAKRRLYEGVMCSCCGEQQATIKGMCNKCYARNSYAQKHAEHYKSRESNTTRTKAIELFSKGIPKAEIARTIGVSRQRISQIIKPDKLEDKK